jgi:uncharacterized protein (DUF362 family)
MQSCCIHRREFVASLAAAGAALAAGCDQSRVVRRPRPPVCIARQRTYEFPSLGDTLDRMFDQLGGLKRHVAGKTVVLKPNLTGNPGDTVAGIPASRSYQVHPQLVFAVASLLDAAGAHRIRIVESLSPGPLENHLLRGGWDLDALQSLRARVDFENTCNLGKGRRYSEVKVPWGGSLYAGYHLNHSYVECDVYVSVAKLKNHRTAGVTLSMKNSFGITPVSLYGQEQPNEDSASGRLDMIHFGKFQPPAGLPPEVAPQASRNSSDRVPRNIVDLVGVRPIDLCIIDGIETISGGEGPWYDVAPVQPGLLVAGLNPVCTDAVATAVMGYDPRAASGTGPFPGDNHLELAAAVGLGTNNLDEIEIVGTPLNDAVFPFQWEPQQRHI